MLLLCRLLGKTVDPWLLKMDADKHVTQYDIGVEQNSDKVVTTTIVYECIPFIRKKEL